MRAITKGMFLDSTIGSLCTSYETMRLRGLEKPINVLTFRLGCLPRGALRLFHESLSADRHCDSGSAPPPDRHFRGEKENEEGSVFYRPCTDIDSNGLDLRLGR